MKSAETPLLSLSSVWGFIASLLMFLYLYGSVKSWMAADPGMFQRFGAVGVAVVPFYIGSMMTDFRVKAAVNIAVAVIFEKFPNYLSFLSSAEKAKDGEIDLKLASKELSDEVMRLVDAHVKEEASERFRKRFHVVEAALISVATLQWGFGDLLYNWVHNCGNVSC